MEERRKGVGSRTSSARPHVPPVTNSEAGAASPYSCGQKSCRSAEVRGAKRASESGRGSCLAALAERKCYQDSGAGEHLEGGHQPRMESGLRRMFGMIPIGRLPTVARADPHDARPRRSIGTRVAPASAAPIAERTQTHKRIRRCLINATIRPRCDPCRAWPARIVAGEETRRSDEDEKHIAGRPTRSGRRRAAKVRGDRPLAPTGRCRAACGDVAFSHQIESGRVHQTPRACEMSPKLRFRELRYLAWRSFVF